MKISHLPDFIEKVIVLVGDAIHHVLACLVVVLQDDGDIHVDDDEEADDKIGEKEGDGHDGVPAVSLISRLRISWKTNI